MRKNEFIMNSKTNYLKIRNEKNNLIDPSFAKINYRPISLPDDYSGAEKRLISIIQEIYPQFDWLNEIPFRRDCSAEEIILIEHGLKSKGFEERYNALLNFIDLDLLAKKEIPMIEQQMREKLKKYFDLPFPEEIKVELAKMLHQQAVQGYKEQIKMSFIGLEDQKKLQESSEPLQDSLNNSIKKN